MLWGGTGGFRERVLDDVQDNSLTALVPGWYNSVATRVASKKAWRHFEKQALLQAPAPYSTGTITVTNGSAVVTGSGTVFATTVAGQVLDGPDDREYKILTRDSATQITLIGAYIGATAAAQTYSIVYNKVAVPSDFQPHRLIALGLQDAGGGGGRLTHVDTPDLLNANSQQVQQTGRPTHYRYFEGAIYLWPAPSTAMGLDCYYKKTWTRLTVDTASLDAFDLDTDWPDELQEAILLGTTARALRYMENDTWMEVWRDFEDVLVIEAGRDSRGVDSGGQLQRWDSGRRAFLSPGVFPRRYPTE